ncbi:MAG: hypothetical protein K2P87_16640 [Lachnospiraceae bacterium]|nr:hypothetical protein [Lachnospiraceae bacterium]
MEAFDWAYRFMKEVTIPVEGYEITLWQLFLFVVVAGILVWVVRRMLD